MGSGSSHVVDVSTSDTTMGSESSVTDVDSSRPATSATPSSPCRFYARGRCKYGSRCRYSHEPREGQTRLSVNTSLYSAALTDNKDILTPKGVVGDALVRRPCHFFNEGKCYKGDKCSYVHDKAMQEESRIRKEQMKANDQEKTLTRTVCSSTCVTFGPGLCVTKVMAGFEACGVRVHDLPRNTTRNDLVARLTEVCVNNDDYQVLSLRDNRIAQLVFKDRETGLKAVEGMNNSGLKTEINTVKTSRPEMNSSSRDCEVLTVSWQEPCIGCLVNYGSEAEARLKVRDLDGTLCNGRTVQVANATDQQRTGKVLKNFVASAVTINGLPVGTTPDAIRAFSGGTSIIVLKGRKYDMTDAHRVLRGTMEGLGGLKEYATFLSGQPNGIVVVKARFESWSQAKVAYDHFETNNKPPCIDGAKLRVSLPERHWYSLCIPRQQYTAQRSVFDELVNKHGDPSIAKISVQERNNYGPDKPVWLTLRGNDTQAVGALKIQLERIIEGERLDLWDTSFASEEGAAGLLELAKAAGVHILPDKRLRILRVFGRPDAIQAARTKIHEEIQRRSSLDYVVHLKKYSVGFFVREGVSCLRESKLVDGNSITLDVTSSPPTIMIRGGDDARHLLRRLVMQSLGSGRPKGSESDERICPVCGDTAFNPFSLACDHIYCSECLMHLCSSASNVKQFPVKCLGDAGRCGREISIPTLSQFLRPTELNHLLEVSFQTYLEHHPNEYKYCNTPDCSQIYRLAASGSQPVPLQCPSCLTWICTAGHEDHPGQTCAEWTIHNDPEEQERLLSVWVDEQGAKKCPSCNAIIEKDGGCNHISCRCGAHICWKCMGLFPSGEIYTHLNNAHGGHTDFDGA
ncbi:hypothetical protein NEOLEDRAFT_1124945 [Neolentinus lepideus HHB14362 ss-1]|uniref:RING-type E3 ubiquitin transferase n=1 Tax=Neolentinus lepideus HHB14362 ss-1 TaxID=1314782 RepID=A0A165MV62_9AGAM|nr:hypothetical protein NEOLEDRAFT_1124945 [Neolentinus lepideus HHB14362 ss-1]